MKNLAELKTEMSIDTKQLSEQNTIKTLLATKSILDKKLQKVQEENRCLEVNLKEERQNLDKIDSEVDAIKDEIRQLDAVEIKATDKKYGISVIFGQGFFTFFSNYETKKKIYFKNKTK